MNSHIKIYKSVAAVFVLEDRVYMAKRQVFLEAFPGYHAFPGGKLEENDYEVTRSKISTHFPTTNMELANALVREINEELGIDLIELSEKNILQEVNFIGIATTPDFVAHRFETHFFSIKLSKEISFILDHSEIEFGIWARPEQFLEQFNQGEILLVQPLISILKSLVNETQNTELENLNYRYNSQIEVPVISPINGIQQALVLSNTLYPATHTNCYMIGRNTPLIIDPSPKDKNEFDKLYSTLLKIKPKGILITHHHQDHHQYVVELAKELNLSIKLSQDTFNRISKKKKKYFEQIETIIVKDQDHVCDWNFEKVRAYQIPGHDEGQLGLMPDSRKWFLVGDLIQGIGTVVIGGDEGNMNKYFDSLRKVILLNPGIILPSHGIALGSTFRLQKTLEHRQMRENQILKLSKLKMNPDEMVDELYQNLATGMKKYALSNVLKHLDKLRDEKKI